MADLRIYRLPILGKPEIGAVRVQAPAGIQYAVWTRYRAKPQTSVFTGLPAFAGNDARGKRRVPHNFRSATCSTRCLSRFSRIRSARRRVGVMLSRRLTRLIRVQMSVAVSMACESVSFE